MRTIFARIVLVAALLCLVAARPASAEIRILASPGGKVGAYLALFKLLRDSGQRIVIDGPCLSACTLVLDMVPRRRICVTRRAVLGFHAASSRDAYGHVVSAPKASRLVLRAYPRPVRNWIVRHGGLNSHLLLLRGRELASMYRRCR